MIDDNSPEALKARLDKLGADAPTAGMIPNWQRNDLFEINSTQEVNIKRALARECGVQYDTVGLDKPIAREVASVQPYSPDNIQTNHKQYIELGKGAKGQKQLDAAAQARPPRAPEGA